MKKSSFIALIAGTVGGILLSLGLCMCLVPEWNVFTSGVIVGAIGFVVLMTTLIIWRRAENKATGQTNNKTAGAVTLGVAGSLLLGLGMCFVMVWGNIVLGIIVGIVGIIALLSIIPLIFGLK